MNDMPSDPGLKLDRLYAHREAPPGQERLVLDAYRGRRDARSRGGAGWGWARRAAVWLLLFGAGFLTASRLPSTTDGGPEPRFMFLMWEGPDFGSDTPGADFSAEYAAWAEDAIRTGVTLEGHEFDPNRALVGSPREAPGEQTRLGGYFLVSSPDLGAARRLAANHPHLSHGGWIEVAPLR